MFDQLCSVYKDGHDAYGRFVDTETGEIITEMTIREFCLTDRWKPQVECLRDLVAKYGATAAKKMPEYKATKEMLPGATPSGLFDLFEDESLTNPGQRVMVRRRETHLLQHTGWLVIDIDLGDNVAVSNFDNIFLTLRFRSEVGLLMHSCSGTGFFGLVRMSPPPLNEDGSPITLNDVVRWHKAQFRALLKDYARHGINLDKSCSNIGRVRFASWDAPENIYINENCQPYRDFDYGEDAELVVKPSSTTFHPSPTTQGRGSSWWLDPSYILRMTELLVAAMVNGKHSITYDYESWVRAGWSLKEHPNGEQLFQDLSSLDDNYSPAETQKKWRQLGGAQTVTHEYLFSRCRKELGDIEYKRISNEAWNTRY